MPSTLGAPGRALSGGSVRGKGMPSVLLSGRSPGTRGGGGAALRGRSPRTGGAVSEFKGRGVEGRGCAGEAFNGRSPVEGSGGWGEAALESCAHAATPKRAKVNDSHLNRGDIEAPEKALEKLGIRPDGRKGRSQGVRLRFV